MHEARELEIDEQPLEREQRFVACALQPETGGFEGERERVDANGFDRRPLPEPFLRNGRQIAHHQIRGEHKAAQRIEEQQYSARPQELAAREAPSDAPRVSEAHAWFHEDHSGRSVEIAG